MLHWTVTPDWIHVADEHDHPGDEAEAAYCFPYGSQWIGFAEMRRVRKSGNGVVERATTINWELLISHDGRHWSRPIRKLFITERPLTTKPLSGKSDRRRKRCFSTCIGPTPRGRFDTIQMEQNKSSESVIRMITAKARYVRGGSASGGRVMSAQAASG